jgi:hypothetical protein
MIGFMLTNTLHFSSAPDWLYFLGVVIRIRSLCMFLFLVMFLVSYNLRSVASQHPRLFFFSNEMWVLELRT